MDAESIQVMSMFRDSQMFCVPIYQRKYKWSRKDQLEPLWEEIREKASRRLTGSTNFPHFMGAVVLDGEKFAPGKMPHTQVIDGQQRLITFQMLLAAIRDYANSKKIETIGEKVGMYLINGDSPEMSDRENEIFKIQANRADQEMFKNIIGNDKDSRGVRILKSKYPDCFPKKDFRVLGNKKVPPLLSAYGFFYDSIEDAVECGQDDFDDEFSIAEHHGIEEKLNALWEAAVEDFRFVRIQLGDNEDAQVIFETLNARGKPLLASELIQNYIFHRASNRQNKESIEKLYDTYWSMFDDDFWRHEERQGRYKKERKELFFVHYIAAKTAKIVSLTELFSEYKDFIRKFKFPDTSSELKEIVRYAAIYRSIIEHGSDDALSHAAGRLVPWDISTVYPLIMRIWAEQSLSADQKGNCLNLLVSFIVRRAVCNLTSKKYNKIFLDVIAKLDSTDWSSVEFEKSLLQKKAEINLFPDDGLFRKGWIDAPVYKNVNARAVAKILEEIEKEKRTTKSANIISFKELTVEHILPQKWVGKWPLIGGVTPSSDECEESYSLLEEDDSIPGQINRRDRLKDTIGNLTLLTQPLNSSIRNIPFKDKRGPLRKEALLKMNNEIAEEEKWDEDEIIKRGKKLFEIARKIWPMPEKN